MITSPDGKTIVSSLGWIDGGSLWQIEASKKKMSCIQLSGARYLSLHCGRNGHFSVVHHFESDHLEISVHRFDNVDKIVSRLLIDRSNSRIEGTSEVWRNVPRYYTAYLEHVDWTGYTLVAIESDYEISLKTFDWFDNSYDHGYQAIVEATEVPHSDLIAVSIQRDSKPVLHDPIKNRKVGEIPLAGRSGIPRLYFSQRSETLWASDYDTLLRLDSSTWDTLATSILQQKMNCVALGIGQFTFNTDETICVVTRPHSGDILGVDPTTLKPKSICQTGGHPYDVTIDENGNILARDKKTGELYAGALAPI